MKCHPQCVCLLLQVISFVANCLAENLILNINFKKPIAVTDHAFLSFALDPTTLQHNDFTKNIERSTNLVRGLVPAYIRLGGPQSNFYNFEQVYSHEIDMDPNGMHFGTQWAFMYQWAKNAGLDVVACITPHYIGNELKTDSKNPKNIAELLSFSDRMGYNVSWQLGYECQTRCDLSGRELGQYVTNLREMLKTFPRYANSLITGPDIVAYRTAQQQKYLQDYLHSANTALSAITWHPDLDSVSLNNDSISIHYDNMIAEKDELYKIIGSAAGKTPLWIVESKPQDCKNQYLRALIWTKRLGDAAKFGVQVVMRQLSDLSQATPVYWVSLLYKTLVGRKVLEMKLQSDNENYVYFYSQCAKPSTLYSNGAITIFGINLTPIKVTASLKDLKIKILHQYILSPDFETGNKMFSEKVLLNNKSLNLINDTKLPEINPEIIINSDGLELELPSNGIGFWVIPNAKVEVCISSEEEIIENGTVKKLSKRHEDDIQQDNQEEKEKDINQLNVEDDVKENESQSNLKTRKIYRKQDRKKQKNVGNTQTENQEKVWKSKLLEKIKKLLQNKLQKKNKNKSSNLQRSFTVYLGEEQENSSEEVEEQNLNKEVTEDDPFKNIQDTLKKFKYILLKKKAKMEIKSTEDHQSEVQNIDDILALISKIDAFLLYKETSNEPIMNEVKDKVKNGDKSIIKINNKLNEYFIELENSEVKANIIKRIDKYYNTLYNLLEGNDSKKNSQVYINDDLMEKKRFKRHLDRNSKDSKKVRKFKKRSQIDNLKDYVKQKIKQKKDDLKKGRWKLISSYYSDNSQKMFNGNKNKYNSLPQRDPVKKLFKSDAFENAARHIDHQNLIQEHNRLENNIYKNMQYSKKSMLDHTKHSKISNMEKYQSLIEPERMKRDISKKFVDIRGHLKRDSASRKRSRIGDLKNYLNEKKTRQNDDSKNEGFVVPFNPKTTDSDENNFYGFFRQNPVKGFPEGDIFVTTGDSLEQKEKDYDYVEDEDDGDDILKKKIAQHSQKSTLDHTRDNSWIKEVEDQYKYKPNEFFENIKLSNTIKENSQNYEDLWEAEFSEQHNNNNNNNNKNEITVAASKPFDQLSKIPISSINHQASNTGLKETNLKMEPELKLSNSFYIPSPDFTTKYNYDNYQTSSINYDKLKEENSVVMNINNRDHIKTRNTQYSRPSSICTEHSIRDETFYNKRKKRSNWENLRKIFAEEMIKEDEKNARDCHCRVIRATDLPKKIYQRRVKYNTLVPTARTTDTSSENKNVSADVEEYEEIIKGEILPSVIVIDSDNEENDTSTESVITELNTMDHKLNDTTQAIDEISTSRTDNISKQYYNAMGSTTNRSPLDSTSEVSLNNNYNIKRETFFRAQSSDVESENKTKTYDSSQVISTIPSEDKNDQEELVCSVAKKTLETTYAKVRDPTIEKEKTDSTIYPTTTEDQKNEGGHNNNYKIERKSTDSLKETTEAIAEQVTTETILLQQAASTTIDNSKLDESKTKSKLRNIEDNQTNKTKARIQLEKDANTRRIKTISQNLPRASLERLTKCEGRLLRRAEQIDKLKEKLYARRKELLHQYQNKLIKIADEQKRNLKKREAWERLHESDDYQLIDQEEFIRNLLDNDITYEEDGESYLIPIKLIPKQYNNIIDQIYLFKKAKNEQHYPKHNKYYQLLQNIIDEKLRETSKSSERKYNQHYIPKIEDKQEEETSRFLDSKRNKDCQSSSKIEDKQESTETTSGSFDHKVFINDPSTYYGGESFLQIHEDYLKFPKYHSKFKSKIHDPTSRWILRNFPQILSKLKSSEAQHQVFKSQEYMKKLPLKDYYDQENVNILYVLGRQRQYNPSKKLSQIWLSSFDQRDSNQAISNKEAGELHNMRKNLKKDKDNLASTSAINKETEFMGSEIERKIENKEFANSNNRKRGIVNSKTTKNPEEVVTTKKSVELVKHEEINKSYNSNNNAENNLNIKMFNNNKAAKVDEKIINDDTKAKELGKEIIRTRRDIGKQTDERLKQLPYNFRLSDDMRNKLDSMNFRLNKNFLKKIFNKDPKAIILLAKIKSPSADLFRKSKNYLISSRKDFEVNKENEQEHEANYIALMPIKFKNIYKMLDVKDNDESSLENSEISARWDDQYVLRKIPGSRNKYLGDETLEEFEYEDLSTLLSLGDETLEDFEYEELSTLSSENNESIPDEESSYKDEQDISVEDSEVESEKDEQYKITNDEFDNKSGIFVLLPSKNMKERQRRQIKNEINEDIGETKHEVTRQSQPNKLILAEDLENKRNKRYYLNNIINKEEENMIETNDIKVNYLQTKNRINKKNRDNLLEDFIKAQKKNNLYNNKALPVKNEEKNEILPLNSVSKGDEKLLQKAIPKLQNYVESVEEFINDSEENFNGTLTTNEDKHQINRAFETSGNIFYTAIMNIKNFFTFFSKLFQTMHKF